MNPKTTLVLMILTLLIGGAAIYSHFFEKEKRDEQEQKEKKVFSLENKKLKFFKIIKDGKNITLLCTKTEGCPFNGTGEWSIKEPIESLGDASSIGSLASSVLNLQMNDKVIFEEKVNPTEFGLGGFRLEIGIQGQDQAVDLDFGETSPVTSDVYVSTSLQPKIVYLVPSFLKDQLKKDLFHWQNKKIFPHLHADSIHKIRWEGNTSLSLEQKDGIWKINKPISVEANSEVIDGLVNGLVLLEAKKIQDGFAQTVKKKKADLSVYITSEEDNEVELQLYKVEKSGELFATQNNSKDLYTVEKGFLDRFEKKTDEYRARKLVHAKDFANLEKVVFQFPKEKQSAAFLYKDNKWYLEGTVKEEFALDRVENIINQLVESDVKNFVEIDSSTLNQLKNPDFVIEGYSSKEKIFTKAFSVYKKKELVTLGELPHEILTFTEAFSRVYPIRLSDLYQKNNKTVVSSGEFEEKKEKQIHDGHNH